MKPLVMAAIAALFVSGCATNRPMTDEGLALAVRVAVRHALADSPRAREKAQNIRSVVLRLQAIATTDSAISGLREEAKEYIATLNLSDLERADALDVLDYFAAVIDAQLGDDTFEGGDRFVKVQEFLSLILAAVPNS